MRHALGGRVRAVGRAERVVDVEVGLRRELLRELRVVRGLARVEARVLEYAHAAVRAEQLAQPFLDGRHRERRIGPLRPPEVRADDHLGRVALEQQPERRQRRADPRVVGDATVLERHVQVGPDQHALAGDVGVANRTRQLHAVAASTGSVAPIIAIRSTSRQL